MALTDLVFCDSFAHYDNTSLKWDIAGGVIDSAHPRTGPNALRVSDADGHPGLNTAIYLHTVGFGLRPLGTVDSKTILEVIDTGIPEIPISLGQNVDGSVTIYSLGLPVATSPAGVMQAGTYTYLEFVIDLGLGSGVSSASVIATDPAGVATIVIPNTVFPLLANPAGDQIIFGGTGVGTSYAGYFADIYIAIWDGFSPDNLGAPKIYGQCVPISDGSQYAPPQVIPFDQTAAPFWSQVNALPENLASFIWRSFALSSQPFVIYQGFLLDVTTVPLGSIIAGLQACHLFSFSASPTQANNMSPGMIYRKTGPGGPYDGGQINFATLSIAAGDPPLPFHYRLGATLLNAANAYAPFILADFTGPAALEFGPLVGQPQ